MFKLPATFRNDYENYMTSPVIKSFLYHSGVKFKWSMGRMELIELLESFANNSGDNRELVQEWIDNCTKEGIKYVFIKKIDEMSLGWEKIINNELQESINNILSCVENKHLCNSMNWYDMNIRLIKYNDVNTEWGRVLSFYFCKKIHTYDRMRFAKESLYPVFVDIYVDYKIAVGRGKSKAGMYEYRDEGFDHDCSTTTDVTKEVGQAFKYLTEKIGVSYLKGIEVNRFFRKKFFYLLDKYTKTPDIIKQKMQNKDKELEECICFIKDNICELGIEYKIDIEKDMLNLVEKYFSISYPDKSIFTEGRDAYPLKIIATDEEESHMEQAAGAEEPLQAKAIFFDNKKMMQKSKLCDGFEFKFHKITPVKSDTDFRVGISAKKDYCLLKFSEFMREEDILHVLFSIINAE